MGWLGWTEKEALEADVNSIMIAMEGRLEMMYPEIKEKIKSKQTVSERFKAMAADHNRRLKDARS